MQIVISSAGDVPGGSGSSSSDHGAALPLGVVVVHVDGEIDLHTGPRLRAALSDLLEPPQQVASAGPADAPYSDLHPAGAAQALTALVLDLTQVTFLDSYALGVVVQAAKKARARRIGFALAGVSGPITKLFEMTGLHRVIALHPDVAAAVTASR